MLGEKNPLLKSPINNYLEMLKIGLKTILSNYKAGQIQWCNVACWRPSALTAPPFLAPLPHLKSKKKLNNLSYFRKYATKIHKNVCFQSNMHNFASTLVKFSKQSHIQTTIWRPPHCGVSGALCYATGQIIYFLLSTSIIK